MIKVPFKENCSFRRKIDFFLQIEPGNLSAETTHTSDVTMYDESQR